MSYTKYLKAICKPDYSLSIECQCGRARNVADLFYCKKCVEYSCDQCTKRQIENFFCPQCRHPYHSYVVKKRQSRCLKCVSCPICDSFVEKVFLLGADHIIFQCAFCFWSSDSLGLHGSSAQNLVEKINKMETLTHQKLSSKVNELICGYQTKLDDHSPYNYSRTQKTGVLPPQHEISPSEIPKLHAKYGTLILDNVQTLKNKRVEQLKQANMAVSENSKGIEETEEVNSSFIQKYDLSKITSLEHRLADPARQSQEFARLCPSRKKLMTKISYRCPQPACNTLLCKPSMALRECTFDTLSLAMHVLPKLSIMQIEGDLECNAPNDITILMENHTEEIMFIKIEELSLDDDPHSNTHVHIANREQIEIGYSSNEERLPPKQTLEGGHWIQGHKAGFRIQITPTSYHEKIQFCVRSEMKTGVPQSDGASRSIIIPFKIVLTLPPPTVGFATSEDKNPEKEKVVMEN